jgi:hypothetical protein
MFSRIIRLFAAEAAREDRASLFSDDERLSRFDRERDRKSADSIGLFVWSWQFPSRL